MEESSVIFKGTSNGLAIIINENKDFENILDELQAKIISAARFFKGAAIDVVYRGKELSLEEEEKVYNILCDKSGAEIKSFGRDSKQNVIPKDTTKVEYKTKMKYVHFTGIDEGVTKYIRGTVRSGQLVKFDGNVVIVGDVNPGGEVVAAGNVTVMGSLRGMVHAGADGNKNVIIAALNLHPTQLRIADVITRPPDESDSKGSFIPELAYVKDNMVYIDRYLPQHKWLTMYNSQCTIYRQRLKFKKLEVDKKMLQIYILYW